MQVAESETASRLAILEVVNRCGRAVDVRDNGLYRTCFWPGPMPVSCPVPW
jgi:hypothetical protein